MALTTASAALRDLQLLCARGCLLPLLQSAQAQAQALGTTTNAASASASFRSPFPSPTFAPRPSSFQHASCSYSTTPSPCGALSPTARLFPLPSTLPKFKKIPQQNSDDVSWRRMVLRFPPEVKVDLNANILTLSGRAGTVRVNLKHMDPTGTVGMQFFQQTVLADNTPVTHTLMTCVSPSKHYFRGIATHIENQIHGVLQGYLVGITLKGVGYRFEPVEDYRKINTPYFDTTVQEKVSIGYPVQKACRAVRLKVGFTFTVVVPLPEDLRAFIVKPTMMYVYGLQKHRVMSTARHIRAVQPPNPYTGNGIRLVDEQVKLRPRAGTK